MTINMSQGQSVKYVGLDLHTPVFSHGQLYVALSRCTHPHCVKAIFPHGQNSTTTTNVVFTEVLRDLISWLFLCNSNWIWKCLRKSKKLYCIQQYSMQCCAINEGFLEWDTIADCGQDVDEVEVIDKEIKEINNSHHMAQICSWFTLQFKALYTVSMTIIEAITLVTQRAEPISYHTSILSGEGWMLELLNGYPERICTELGIHKHVFRMLVEELKCHEFNHSKHVTLKKQLRIFLYITVTGLKIRHVDHFQWLKDTISK